VLELPEAITLARQIEETLRGRRCVSAVADHSPHKFAWYYGDPAEYGRRLSGRQVLGAEAHGGMVEIVLDGVRLVFGDGALLRYVAAGKKRPTKHQLLVELDDGAAVFVRLQMYGGIWCFPEGEFDNPYYEVACRKPAPLSGEFDESYFTSLLDDRCRTKSAKAFLATEQRIPGLGNGVLQDILWNARISPRRKMDTLTDAELAVLFKSVKSTLQEMVKLGGRDTEKDFFGQPGGYITRMSKNTWRLPCPVCGGEIKKEAYLGGSVYHCPGCQK
jgi:formamidopyrimidine-DNA glycosylase